jgi:hypothetical protein
LTNTAEKRREAQDLPPSPPVNPRPKDSVRAPNT